MAALGDLLGQRTGLSDAQILHLQRLVGEWQLLADLSFADLLLWVPFAGDSSTFLCVAHCRPTTSQTAYPQDEVGSKTDGEPIAVAFEGGRIFREGDPEWHGDLPIRREAIPIRHEGKVIAVLGRDSNLASVRSPSQLELVYLQSASDLAVMVADGTFPGEDGSVDAGGGPRVGDGLIRVAPDSTIAYASPNAVSALRRLGVSGKVIGEPIAALTTSVANDPFDAGDLALAVETAIGAGTGADVELDGGGATVLFRSLPLRPAGESVGALILLQDNTELRRRDRALLSKDATIREIHHRVKNNLQTVAALLRLQSRRVAAPEARAALEESMRRIDSIALVHETLSVSMDESVPFDDVLDRLLTMLRDVTGADDRVDVERIGTFGAIPAEVATSLVLVITELVQNATEHAFPDGRSGHVTVRAARRGGALRVSIIDDGAGLPPTFDLAGSDRLGLNIVKTLVTTELSGTFDIRPRTDGFDGTEVQLTARVHPESR